MKASCTHECPGAIVFPTKSRFSIEKTLDVEAATGAADVSYWRFTRALLSVSNMWDTRSK